jgi:hypothetical protein
MSLKEAIRELIRDTGEREPGVLARKVVESCPDDDLREALMEACPSYARDVIRGVRHAAKRTTSSIGAPTSQRFGDVAALTANLADWQVWVPGSGRKRFIDLTESDLDAVVAYYLDEAEASKFVAGQYEATKHALKQHGCLIVGDLPSDIIQEIWP